MREWTKWCIQRWWRKRNRASIHADANGTTTIHGRFPNGNPPRESVLNLSTLPRFDFPTKGKSSLKIPMETHQNLEHGFTARFACSGTTHVADKYGQRYWKIGGGKLPLVTRSLSSIPTDRVEGDGIVSPADFGLRYAMVQHTNGRKELFREHDACYPFFCHSKRIWDDLSHLL